MADVGRIVVGSIAALVAAAAVAACSGASDSPELTAPSADPGAGGPSAAAASPTFHEDVEPLLQAHCQKCHRDGGIAPFSLLTYEQAKIAAPAMVVETGARRMPPWNAQDTAECKPRLPWNHDERLTDVEIDTIAKWSAAGAPEGDPAKAPPAVEPPSNELAGATVTLTPKAPFVASGDRDEFRCFVLDHPFTQGAYLGGVHVLPGNKKVVHHAVVFTDPTGDFAKRAGPDGSFDCSSAAMAAAGGGQTQGQSVTLDVWVPGQDPVDLPANIAMPLAASAKIIMQIHYSPGGKTAEPDTTRVQLRAATTRPDYLLFTTAIGNFASTLPSGDGLQKEPDEAQAEFRIPANARGHVERMRFTVPTIDASQTIWIYGVLAHEHLAGVDVKVDLERDGDSQCLLEDRWDFHWQRMYTYAAPVEKLPTLRTGDRVALRCTYDNTMDNRRLGPEYEARGLQPMDLKLGEQTTDEMCLVIPQLLVKNPIP